MRSIERCLAVIPARGGSKRIPRKNVRPFCGRPLIAWTIDEAVSSGCFADVIVNTDDDEIASVASELGVSVYRRPTELGGDDVMVDDVLSEMGSTMFGGGVPFGCVVLLNPTSPARLPDLMPSGLDEWSKWDDGAVVSVGRVENYWYGMVVDGDELVAVTPQRWLGNVGRPPVYVLDGAFYAFPSEVMSRPSPLPWWEDIRPLRPLVRHGSPIVDLDDDADWGRGEEVMSEVIPLWGWSGGGV